MGGDVSGVQEEGQREEVLRRLKEARRVCNGARAECILAVAELDKLILLIQSTR